jgi:hypothetical protein
MPFLPPNWTTDSRGTPICSLVSFSPFCRLPSCGPSLMDGGSRWPLVICQLRWGYTQHGRVMILP